MTEAPTQVRTQEGTSGPPARDPGLRSARGQRRRRLEEGRRLEEERLQEEHLQAPGQHSPAQSADADPPVGVADVAGEAGVVATGLTRRAMREAERAAQRKATSTIAVGSPKPAVATGPQPATRRAARAAELSARKDPPRSEKTRAPRRRVRLLAVLLVVLLVAALVLASGLVWALLSPKPTPATAVPAAQTRTLLIVLDDGSDRLVEAALLGVQRASGSDVLIPGGLQVDGLGDGRPVLADALATTPGPTPAEVLGSTLGVRIDGSWRLSPAALAQAVDAVGGVVVDVDREVLAGDVFVSAGPAQRLKGAQAAAFAAFLDTDEPEQARLARFGSVMTALLAALPSAPAEVAGLAGDLDGASSTLAEPRLAAVLAGLHQVAAGGNLTSTVLPVDLVPGDSAPADNAASVSPAAASPAAASPAAVGPDNNPAVFTLDGSMAAPMLSAQFADAVQPRSATGVIRVAVRNGAGVTGLSDAARQRLEAVGMHYVGGGNADSFGHAASEVLVPTGSPADRQRGEQVATALGLSPVTVIVGDQPGALDDVTVVLGRDFADDVTARGVLPTMTP